MIWAEVKAHFGYCHWFSCDRKDVISMASNFKILIHKNSESLHLKLMGDFDGTSAHELLNTIKGYGSRIKKITIHTSGLREVNHFGKTVFDNNFSNIRNRFTTFVFTGDKVDNLSPNR
jgi:hypothetical protein